MASVFAGVVNSVTNGISSAADSVSSVKDSAIYKLWNNNADDLITSYSFSLLVDGVTNVPLRSVKAFRKEAEFEYVQEGGLNDYVHMLRKGATKPFTFQVERYADTSVVIETLPIGYEATLPMLLMIYDGRNITSNMPIRTYAFTGAVVMSKEYGELNSERSGLLTETITIGYRELMCVNSDLNKINNLANLF